MQSPDIDDSESTWIQASVQGAGTLKFCWKVSSQSGDNMSFSIDGEVVQGGLSGNGDWGEQQSYNVSGSGTHTFRWTYGKDASGAISGDFRGGDWGDFRGHNTIYDKAEAGG